MKFYFQEKEKTSIPFDLGLKEEKRKSKINRESVASTVGKFKSKIVAILMFNYSSLVLVEQLRQIIGVSLDEAVKHNSLADDDLSVPRFLIDCIQIIDQGK